MDRATWMRKATLAFLGAWALLPGCQAPEPAAGGAGDRAVLLGFYEAQRQAHFEGDAEKFFAAVDTGYWSINNGEVAYRRKEAAVASADAYFGSIHIDEVRDISAPRLSFSSDGRTAWLVGEVAVRGRQRDATGAEQPLAFQAAWVDLYRKTPAGWRLELRANTERMTPGPV